MVARGDLGLEMPLEQVPQVQKQVLRSGRDRGVPVIVATQVLESMRTESRPTRAEVSDAAGAVDAGADAIMLSGETAVGDYPVRAVQVLDAIIRNAEAVPPPWTLPAPADERPDHLPPLCDAAVTLAARAGADAIVAITREGRTARLLSARRPTAPIYAVTDTRRRGAAAVPVVGRRASSSHRCRTTATPSRRASFGNCATRRAADASPSRDREREPRSGQERREFAADPEM